MSASVPRHVASYMRLVAAFIYISIFFFVCFNVKWPYISRSTQAEFAAPEAEFSYSLPLSSLSRAAGRQARLHSLNSLANNEANDYV